MTTIEFDFLSLHKTTVLNEQHFSLEETSHCANYLLQLVRSCVPWLASKPHWASRISDGALGPAASWPLLFGNEYLQSPFQSKLYCSLPGYSTSEWGDYGFLKSTFRSAKKKIYLKKRSPPMSGDKLKNLEHFLSTQARAFKWSKNPAFDPRCRVWKRVRLTGRALLPELLVGQEILRSEYLKTLVCGKSRAGRAAMNKQSQFSGPQRICEAVPFTP